MDSGVKAPWKTIERIAGTRDTGAAMKIIRAVLGVLIAANMAFIFCNSAKPSIRSNEDSKKIAGRIAAVMRDGRNMPDTEKERAVARINAVIRELAHVLEFAALGVWATLYLETCPKLRGKRFPRWKKLTAAALFCMLYAVSDEAHQLFVLGRTCEVFDVAADTLGAGAAAFFVSFVRTRAERKAFSGKGE